MGKPRCDPPRRTSGGVTNPVPPPVRPRIDTRDSRRMPLVEVPPGWEPPAMLPGDPPGDWDRRELGRHLEHQEVGWFDAPPSWWKVRARRRWRDRVPRGFR